MESRSLLPVAFVPRDVSDSLARQSVQEIAATLEEVSDHFRRGLGGRTFRLEDILVHRSQTQDAASIHWQNAVREVPVEICSDRHLVYVFAAGSQAPGGGTVGRDWWQCRETQMPPGVCMSGWTGLRLNGSQNPTAGAIFHELGHGLFGLGHPMTPSAYALHLVNVVGLSAAAVQALAALGDFHDPRARGPNAMGGGWTLFPDEFYHPLDLPVVVSSPWIGYR